jgi:hypothetical protein
MELNFTFAEEQASFNKVEKDTAWQVAMHEEMKAIEDNDTWELTSLPVGHHAIDLKWVSKVNAMKSAMSYDTRCIWWPRATSSAPASTSMMSLHWWRAWSRVA